MTSETAARRRWRPHRTDGRLAMILQWPRDAASLTLARRRVALPAVTLILRRRIDMLTHCACAPVNGYTVLHKYANLYTPTKMLLAENKREQIHANRTRRSIQCTVKYSFKIFIRQTKYSQYSGSVNNLTNKSKEKMLHV